MSYVLAVDLGGTRFRAALVDDRGGIAHSCFIESPARASPAAHPGWDEIDADAWWNGLQALTDALAAQADAAFSAVEAIAICGVTRTQVFIDAHGAAIRPAITWRDTRAAADVGAWLASMPSSHPEHGQINAFHPWARVAWLLHAEPEHAARVRLVLEPKDYLNFRLTGRTVSDTVSMARLAAAATAGPDCADLLTAVGANPAWVPRLLDPLEVVGVVQKGLSGALARLSGRPVVACANDTWAAVAGLGALRPGYAYNISGTTEVFGAVGAEPVQAQGLMTVDWGGGHHQIGGPGQNGADTVAWLLPLLGRLGDEGMAGVGEAMDALLDAPRDPQPALFLPYLQGERVPYWDPHLRGAFLGLNRRHGPGDLAWAVLEGVAFLNRIVLERAESALGSPVEEIRFGGGAASNAQWCQVKADICERALVVGQAEQPGVLGAAVAAWTGLGRYGSFAAAQDALVRVAQRYEPQAERAHAYRRMYRQFRAAEAALAPVSRALAGIDMG
ncbi:FGGY-family carbohydrate kinase [Achromobacter sp. ACM02]|uniref:xylulokinase n=1 Tax=Achromobacter TaxID=222 RepID=UPI001465EBCD|nr:MULTISPECIES: FGGY-family carbohydrate kinase [Achromobacter]MBD9383346.1 FGGY-family carbohydrate kinase [Achromobacter sp. ACM02]MBD9471932.1 FGGY-family carbohydrate kinase [Achromobacter sp. ACM01]CAB3813580.1 Xylulose kinase [Achromobacter aegrifaciens]